MKVCSRCKHSKELTEFNKNKCKPDGLQTFCRECGKQKSAEHYSLNKSDYNQNRVIRRLKCSQFVYDYLKTHPCIDCGENDPVTLEFDHINNKLDNISVMIHDARPIEQIQLEINKCQVRCANCHKKKTAREQGWYKSIIT